MANSIFVGTLGTSTGTSINPSLPIGFPDGTAPIPSITFASELGLGFYRAGSGLLDFSATNYSTTVPMTRLSGGVGLIIGGGVGLGFANSTGATSTVTTYMRSVGAGQVNICSTSGETSGIGFNLATDAVLLLRTRAQSAYATLDCLGLKSSGTACASFGPSAVASITVVNGLITAIS